MLDNVWSLVQKNRKLIVILLAGLILILVFRPMLAILPAFEGVNSGCEGVEISGAFYRIDNPSLPSPSLGSIYWWGSQDPRAAVLYKDTDGYFGYYGHGAVRAEVQTPQLAYDPFMVGREVDYWVKVSDTDFKHIKGQINVYNFALTVSAVNTYHLQQSIFTGEKLWFTLTAVTWNKAHQEQSPYTGNTGYGQAWEAPLAVVIEKYDVQSPGAFGVLDPSEMGRWITLYDSTQQVGTISDLGVKTGTTNSTLAGEVSPDSRMRRTAYFAITLTRFGITETFWIVTSAPVAKYNLKLYTIQIGKYTYQNPEDTPWGEREPDIPQAWLESFLEFLYSVAVGPSLSTLMIIVVIVMTGVILGVYMGKRKGR